MIYRAFPGSLVTFTGTGFINVMLLHAQNPFHQEWKRTHQQDAGFLYSTKCERPWKKVFSLQGISKLLPVMEI
jgi:hypothetical protein